MSSLGKHVIHQPKPHRWVFGISVIIIVTASYVWTYLSNQSSQVVSELADVSQREQALAQENSLLKEKLSSLTELLEQNQQLLAIQTETDKQLQQRINTLQNNAVELNKALLFYQNITQGTGSSKLQIREFELLTIMPGSTDSAGYRVVFTQGNKINKPLTGTISISLDYADKTSVLINEHKLNLRHVQLIEGMIKLPNDIAPKSVTVKLVQNKKTTLSKTIEWKINP